MLISMNLSDSSIDEACAESRAGLVQGVLECEILGLIQQEKCKIGHWSQF